MSKLSWFAFLTGPATEIDFDVEPTTISSHQRNGLTGKPFSAYDGYQENVVGATAGYGQPTQLPVFFTDTLQV